MMLTARTGHGNTTLCPERAFDRSVNSNRRSRRNQGPCHPSTFFSPEIVERNFVALQENGDGMHIALISPT